MIASLPDAPSGGAQSLADLIGYRFTARHTEGDVDYQSSTTNH
jgi:hypothetical protein